MGATLTVPATITLGLKLSWHSHWLALRRIDEAGPWTLQELMLCTGATERGGRALLRQLLAVGVAAQAGDVRAYKNRRYRLTTRQESAPALERPRATGLAESVAESIWRAIRMAKSFTVDELVADLRLEMQHARVRRYVLALAQAGILGKSGAVGRETFRLKRNVGSRAPVIVQLRGVYDPNAASFARLLADEVWA